MIHDELCSYAQTVILVKLILVKLISLLVITSYGVGVSTSNFGRNFLLGLLYLPVTTTDGLKSARPYFLAPKRFMEI